VDDTHFVDVLDRKKLLCSEVSISDPKIS